MTYLTVAVALLAIAQIATVWRVATKMRSIDRVHERLTHLAEAMALLTDTAEAGLGQIASQLDPQPRRRTRSSPAATSRRIALAARTGRAIGQIAADEQLSEGEVRLHLGMSTKTTSTSDEDDINGALRI